MLQSPYYLENVLFGIRTSRLSWVVSALLLITQLLAGVVVLGALVVAMDATIDWRRLMAIASLDTLALNTFAAAIPLLLVGLAAAVAGRAGILHLGLEGLVFIGALAAGIVAGSYEWLATIDVRVACVGSIVASCGTCAFLSYWIAVAKDRGANDLLLSLFAGYALVYLASLLVDMPVFRDPSGGAQTRAVRLGLRLDASVDTAFYPVAAALALLSCWGLWVFLHRNTHGIRLRGAGQNPQAHQARGFSLQRSRGLALILSGCFVGLAGWQAVLGEAGHYPEGGFPGWGWYGLAVAFVANNRVELVVLVALMLGLTDTVGGLLQHASTLPKQDTGLPPDVTAVGMALALALFLGIRLLSAWWHKWEAR